MLRLARTHLIHLVHDCFGTDLLEQALHCGVGRGQPGSVCFLSWISLGSIFPRGSFDGWFHIAFPSRTSRAEGTVGFAEHHQCRSFDDVFHFFHGDGIHLRRCAVSDPHRRLPPLGLGNSTPAQVDPVAMEKVKDIVKGTALVVFSKSYCPFCTRVKSLFQQIGAKAVVYEMDQMSDGSALQAALHDWTGQRTVPNVFIGGKHVGGCDDTIRLHQEGKLVPMLTEAGAITSAL